MPHEAATTMRALPDDGTHLEANQQRSSNAGRPAALTGVIATAGLAAVLVIMVGFAVAAAVATRQAATSVSRAIRVSDSYDRVQYAIALEQSLQSAYGLDPAADIRAQHAAAGESFSVAIQRIQNEGTPLDRQFVGALRTDHAQYVSATDRMFASVDAGDAATANRTEATDVDPIFSSVQQRVANASIAHGNQAEAARSRFGHTVDVILVLTLVLSTVGLALIGVFWRVLAAYQRRLQTATHAERNSASTLGAILESAADGIITIDDRGAIESFNPAAERLFGYAAPEVIGQNVTMLMPEPFHSEHDRHLARYTETREQTVVGREVLGLRKGGEQFPMELSIGEAHPDGRRVFVGSARDITQRKQLEDRLRYQALHDPLTSLANRRQFTDRLQHGLARQARRGGLVAVLFLDLDEFKSVNDVHGHPAGDELLVAAGIRLRACVRPEDTLARFGGDEFAVLVEEVCDVAEAKVIAARILDAFRLPVTISGTEIFTQVSIGIAVSELGDATADELLRRADVAMYVAKGRGKGRCEVFVPAMQHTIVEHLALASDLQWAVERGELVVYYQPTVSLADGRIVGMEALIRWRHPERGLLPPHEFIGLAEETGLILPIGRWVLGEACAQVRGWQQRYPADQPLAIAVNVSVGQIRQPGLAGVVAEALSASGLPPDSLILEITESVVMEDADLALHRLRELKKLGVRLAIDDFGTGYSSLNYLRRFPVDFLKIDKSFIDRIGRRGKEHDLTRTIIELAKNLGLETVAEGIERPDQLARLRSLHCELGQGYLFGRPMPADAMQALLASADATSRDPARHAA